MDMTAKSPSSRKSAMLVLWFAVMALLAISCSTNSRPSVAPQTRTVEIRGSKFMLGSLTVNVGDTVEFKNNDIVPHTATSTATPPAFDSGRIGVEESWKYVAGKKGVFDYECSFHPNMQGKIIVQ
jgi:plastocyanin